MDLTGFEIPRPVEIPEGAYGVWQVPEINTNTPLYTAPSSKWQVTVDRENAALIYNYGRGRLIADHAGSKVDGGVWRVEKMKLDCAAFLVTKDKTTKYRCTALWRSRYHPTYYSYNGSGVYPKSSLDIICASCVADSPDKDKEVYLAYFQYDGVMP